MGRLGIRHGAIAFVVLSGLLEPRRAEAGFDLSYDPLFVQGFVADQVVSFDDLTPGAVLETGDPVAPGVTFGGVPGNVVERAIVVDEGGGDLALRSVDVGSEAAPQQSRVAFSFASGVLGVGAVASMTAGNSTTTFPLCEIYDGTLDMLNFISVGGPVASFFGWIGDETSRPIRFVSYGYVAQQPETPFGVDDLAILHAPEPGVSALAVAALLALARSASASARRARRTP